MRDRQARSIRLPSDMWDTLEEQARIEKRSVNNLVEVLLDDSLLRRLWKENDSNSS